MSDVNRENPETAFPDTDSILYILTAPGWDVRARDCVCAALPLKGATAP